MIRDPLRFLDEPNAALRILLEVSKHPQGIQVSQLYERMHMLGVGRTAIDSSRRALAEARLVVEAKMKDSESRTCVLLFTTDLGSEVAMKIQQIRELVDKGA